MIISQRNISIGNHVTIGPNVVIYDHDHDYLSGAGTICSAVAIGDNVWIGAGAIILRGSSIGRNCVIGAGSLVKSKIPDNILVYNTFETKQVELIDK